MKINVYDFDGTIYDGNSSIDFYLFCLSRKPSIIKYFPSMVFATLLYVLNLKDKEYLKSNFFQFIKSFNDVHTIVKSFWEKKSNKIKEWYYNQKKNNDLVISASPSFLLSHICNKLKIDLIATEIDIKTGVLLSNNCHGIEKVNQLHKKNKNVKINEFYSDSLNDKPLVDIANSAYRVKKNKIIIWSQYKENVSEKLISIFFARDFLMFLIIGIINTIDVIWMSLLYSLFMRDSIAFIFGWTTSLIVAYSLNSIFNYKEKLSIKKLLYFAFSNIPNFIIQNLTAIIILDILQWDKLIGYFISAIIGVPITFICIKIFVFNKSKKKSL